MDSKRFERIAFVDSAFHQVAVVDVIASQENGKVYAWKVGDAPTDAIQDGYQWARQLRWPDNSLLTPKRHSTRAERLAARRVTP